MTIEDNKQAVRESWKAFASRDPAEIAARFTGDAQWIAPPGNATALALNGAHRMGRDDIVRFISADFGKLFARDVKVEFKEMYAEGDVVIVEQRFQATLASGAAYDNDYCFIIELESALIRRVREYMDTAKGHRMIFASA